MKPQAKVTAIARHEALLKPIEIPENYVFEGVLAAMDQHGRQWFMHVRYEDYMRVRMQLAAMASQLKGVWEETYQLEHVEYTNELAVIKQYAQRHGVTPSNPRASRVAEVFFEDGEEK